MPLKRNAGKDKSAASKPAATVHSPAATAASQPASSLPAPTYPAAAATSEQPSKASSPSADDSIAATLPLWLTEGSTQRDKSVLCESVYIYTPDGKQELIKNARVQFVTGRRYGLIGRNGIGKVQFDCPQHPHLVHHTALAPAHCACVCCCCTV